MTAQRFTPKRACGRLATAILCASLSLPTFAASIDEARIAIRTKQYDKAQQQLTALARAGDVEAQVMLASLYNNGVGIV